MMIKCNKCGQELPDEAMFCFKCGSKVEKKQFCIKCGKELPDGARFCMYCGSEVENINKIQSKCGESERNQPDISNVTPFFEYEEDVRKFCKNREFYIGSDLFGSWSVLDDRIYYLGGKSDREIYSYDIKTGERIHLSRLEQVISGDFALNSKGFWCKFCQNGAVYCKLISLDGEFLGQTLVEGEIHYIYDGYIYTLIKSDDKDIARTIVREYSISDGQFRDIVDFRKIKTMYDKVRSEYEEKHSGGFGALFEDQVNQVYVNSRRVYIKIGQYCFVVDRVTGNVASWHNTEAFWCNLISNTLWGTYVDETLGKEVIREFTISSDGQVTLKESGRHWIDLDSFLCYFDGDIAIRDFTAMAEETIAYDSLGKEAYRIVRTDNDFPGLYCEINKGILRIDRHHYEEITKTSRIDLGAANRVYGSIILN